MWPVSERFLRTLRYSHTKITRVDLYRAAQPLETSLPILSATVDDDYTADIRRRCSVSLPGTKDIMDLLPSQPVAEGGLWPIGNELRIRSGIVYDDGVEELVPMGVFRITHPSISFSSDGDRVVNISGYDRSRAVSRARFVEPYQISVLAEDIPMEIKKLLQDRLPILQDEDFELMSSDYNPPPMTFLRDDDPWKDAAEHMAESIGAEVYFNGLGRAVIRPIPNALVDPITFVYEEGPEATFLDGGRELDDEQGYNGVIANSQSTDTATSFQGERWDTNPSSPTYFDPLFPERSVYGQVPLFFVSEFIRSNQQAQEAAEGLFQSRTGIIENIDLSAICNPAHTSGDSIKVLHSDANIDDINLINSIRFDLTGDTMTVATRRRALEAA